tara:strand:+ start:629 stop:2065 length:1437 start_codon:yes stop_codon:yes gene_type:complete
MVTILDKPGTTFAEYNVLPGYTPKDCNIEAVSLESEIAGVSLRLPFMSAAMGSVSGRAMVSSLGREGGLGVLPTRIPLEELESIIRELKTVEAELGCVEDPITVRENTTIDEALGRSKRHGHSNLPVVSKHGVFLGMFRRSDYLRDPTDPDDLVTTVMLDRHDPKINSVRNRNITDAEIRRQLEESSYLVVLNGQGRLEKLAFQRDLITPPVAAAFSTHDGWEERVETSIAAGVDMMFIDTSDAYSEFVKDAIIRYKERWSDGPPLCVGNVVTEEGALFLMQAGADAIKVGMSSGSICITGREKAVGRAPMAALVAGMNARYLYQNQTGVSIPIIMDGGVADPGDMAVALAIADGVMMGGYFNTCWEAAGPKYDETGQITKRERLVRTVATWGEGSDYAKNLARYGHAIPDTFFAEGVVGKRRYRGRLKAVLKEDIPKLRAALVNVGVMNLREYREVSKLDPLSPAAFDIVKRPHGLV